MLKPSDRTWKASVGHVNHPEQSSTANTIGKVIHGIFGASVPMAIAA